MSALMPVPQIDADLHLDIGKGVSIKKAAKFCYLGDILDADGGCDSALTASQTCLESFVKTKTF